MTKESLAQKIALLLDSEREAANSISIEEKLREITTRLERLEHGQEFSRQQGLIPGSHPSLDKFAIAEAIADKLFSTGQVEKACTFEPNDKPCDHCSMCSARGF